MVYKRPFHDVSDDGVGAYKHPRQQKCTAQLSPTVDVFPCNNALPNPHSDGEGENSFTKSEDEGRIASDLVSEDLDGANKESGASASGSISSYQWFSSNAIDEYAKSDEAVYLSFFPNYFELDHRVRALVQSDDIYSTLLDNPPRKLVSVGPDHQADVPEWAPQGFKKTYLNKSESYDTFAHSSNSCSMDNDDFGNKLMGTCVIPMPDMESAEYNCNIGEGARNNCNCLDGGSVRCVKQHIMEAREKLKENLGQKIYEELGFCDIGEEVANKWNGEEEQAFHEVVLSNPASLGKNFWNHLSSIFPSRKKEDLVSYYFNVFMLQKRAEQNRFDSFNIDSDNDEWQRNEVEMTEEDDDSVVESLAEQYAPAYSQENHEEDFDEGTENEDDIDTCKNDADSVNCMNITAEEDEGDIDETSEAHIGKSSSDCGLGSVFQHSGKISSDKGEDHDIQDDSCTSYEYQWDTLDSCDPVDFGKSEG